MTKDAAPSPRIDATALAQFVRLESCERFLWYRLHPQEMHALLRDYKATEQPLSILLKARGARHEQEITHELETDGVRLVDLSEESADATIAELAAADDGPRALIQPRVAGQLNGFVAAGIADVILVRHGEDGLRICIEDAKASRKDRPEHRVQIGFYATLLRQMAEQAGVAIEELTGAVWRIPQGPDDVQPVPFDLQPYEEAIQLLVDADGPVARVATGRKEDAPFHLTYKCDGCTYNALCMREAADTDSLALVPFMSLRDRKALEKAGVADVESLATLMELPARGDYSSPLVPALGKEAVCARLDSEWPLGANLEKHVQRARAAAKTRGHDVPYLSWIHRAGFGTMPSREVHPDLIQVFLEGQHDYLQDRLYSLSALIVGPDDQTREVIEITDGPPDDVAEAELIVRWVSRALEAARELAGDQPTTIHIYVFDAYDQKVVLDALRRNLDRLAGIPDFFDLLTETPALTQSMFTFLAQEVRERTNLGIICHSLPMVARRLRFDWEFEGVEYHRRFQAKIFDNRRTLADGTWFESAARFNSQIPLEYAYGAWNLLPEPETEEDRPLIEPYRVTMGELLGFLRARLYALQAVEASFKFRNKFLPKEPVELPSAAPSVPSTPALADILVEFLHLEHYAQLQSRLLLFSQPAEHRVASGESIYVEALEDSDGGQTRFRFRFEEVGLDPTNALAQMSPKEGDWMVVSPAGTTKPWDLLCGRIAVIQEIGERDLTVDLLPMSFWGSDFRYRHNSKLEISKKDRYVLDPMADDLVSERLLAACRNASDNEFLAWVAAGGEGVARRKIPEGDEDAVAAFVEALQTSKRVLNPTARQEEVIEEHLGDRILLVQGPPGTGKTHTIAWSILARAYAAAAAGRAFTVLVSSMTHTATDVVLRSLVHKLEVMRGDPVLKQISDRLTGLELYKESLSSDNDVPDGVQPILVPGDVTAALSQDLAIIAAVPGGVHRMLQRLSKPIDWTQKHLDLLVIDEASQVNLPAAVMAGAPLRPTGQALIVGDHRQMPPILAYEWVAEQRRHAQDERVYASTFESLKDRGFPSVGLDESFRLHAMQAEFLENHVYADDHVGFHSKQTRLLPAVAGLEGHVAAALAPRYPVIVVEHTEAESLKQNDVEIAILSPILAAAEEKLKLGGEDGVGVVVPHRAQRAALQKLFPDLAKHGAIDTVERFQGGERDLIIVSATASDPEFVLAEASFLLNPNRLNVAFSRPRKKLIVIGSTTIFRLMPPDMETFEDALLWKRLRYEFSAEVLWEGEIAGAGVRVSGRAAEETS